jgi:hypothetical protein
VPEDGLLPRVATQERTEVFSAKPCGPYLYVRAPVTRARGVRHQVLRRRRARAHVLKALAGHEPMAFFALPQRLRLQTEHVDVDVVDVSSPTSRTDIPDEDTPAPVVSLRRQLPFDYGPLEKFVQPACPSSCANFLERRLGEVHLRRITLPRIPVNSAQRYAIWRMHPLIRFVRVPCANGRLRLRVGVGLRLDGTPRSDTLVQPQDRVLRVA